MAGPVVSMMLAEPVLENKYMYLSVYIRGGSTRIREYIPGPICFTFFLFILGVMCYVIPAGKLRWEMVGVCELSCVVSCR